MGADDRRDLVIYGATGFTGRQLLRYLVAQGHTSWAAAGRRRAALDVLAEKPADIPVIVATLDDDEALRAMTARARVVLNLAGPYAPHAERLVAACIRTGTHYADVSGEVAFTRHLIDRHHHAAREAGVTIVPQCGYESLPFDLLTALLHRTLRRRDGSALEAIRITAHFTRTIHPLRAGVGVSGGTVATTIAFARELGPGRLLDPYALTPAPPSDARAGARTGAGAINLSARRDAVSGHWLSPLAPAPFVNPAVVHRTNALAEDPYAPGFSYEEAFDATQTLGRAPLAASTMARGFAQLVRSIVALSEGRGTRRDRLRLKAFAAIGPRPGAGPRDQQLDGVGYRLHAEARSDSGAHAQATLDAQGNAGYRSTPNMLAEAGLALARGKARAAGVVTPAAAFGPGLLDDLGPAGVTVSLTAGSTAS